MTKSEQLGFGFERMLEEERTADLPSTLDEAIPFYRKLLERHHDAMMAADVEKAMEIREEAHDLAVKLNGGTLLGICGGPEAPACVLERETAAAAGTIPTWGQKGSFIIDVDGVKVRIEQDGIFGVAAGLGFWPGFGAHAVDYQRPFISQTGYRSFLEGQAEVVPGITPEKFAQETIRHYVKRECKGKLARIERGYVERELARRAEKDGKQKEPDL